MHYYGTRLSENISRREPEGYLLCLNVPVARTGIQDYMPEELGLKPDASGPIPVRRPAEEVFSPATVASFEGMPVTNDHPPEGVDISNIRALQKGHAHNVRRGKGQESDLLLADLIITDPVLIKAILEDGKREISCGYTYELCGEDGGYVQRQIRGNHVAVVDAGRAGHRVSIKDHQPERRKKTMKKSLSKVLARMAKDGDVETVAEIIEEMIEPESAAETVAEAVGESVSESVGEAVEAALAAEAAKAAAAETAETGITVDESGLAGILERLDRVIALLEASAADEVPAEEVTETIEKAIETAAAESGDPVTAEISGIMEEILDPVASVVLEAEEEEAEQGLPEVLETGDAMRAALAAVRPALAQMPENMRRKAAGDIAARIRRGSRRGTTGADAYAALASARRRTAPGTADLGRRIMEKRNANYRR